MSETTTHVATCLRKMSAGYRTDDGHDIPPHLLHRYECSCGWKGATWYASSEKARSHFDRHRDSQMAAA